VYISEDLKDVKFIGYLQDRNMDLLVGERV
jgi:hypothetical protein